MNAPGLIPEAFYTNHYTNAGGFAGVVQKIPFAQELQSLPKNYKELLEPLKKSEHKKRAGIIPAPARGEDANLKP